MDSELLFAFIDEAEDTLLGVRNSILALAQGGESAAGLETPLGGVRLLREAAAMIGLHEINGVLVNFEHQLRLVVDTKGRLLEEESRFLLDLLAQAEACVLKIRLHVEDPSFNLAELIDESFDIGRFDASSDDNAAAESGSVMPEEDEFEIDAEMLEIFAMEADDLLRNIDASLGVLATQPNDRDALWEIRRNAHTFKGAAGIVGLKKPSELAHRVEDLLDYLSENKIGPNETIIELLHVSTNCLKSITAGDNSPELAGKIAQVYKGFDSAILALAGQSSEKIEVAAAQTQAQSKPTQQRSVVRVSLSRLDELVKIVRDLVVSRSVVEQRMSEFEKQIEELHNTTRRLQSTSSKIEIDFEAAMLGTQPVFASGGSLSTAERDANTIPAEQFDSLELDRYTSFHQSTRALSEATSDSFAINSALEAVKGNLELLFDDQRRLIEEMQEKVTQIRMLQFGALSTRIQRAVQVTCEEENKKVEVSIENQELEVDTDLLDSLVEPLMHLLRNAVVHGIEAPDTRRLLGKPESGKIIITLVNEETHLVLRVCDDGRGITGALLKDKALSAGLIDASTADAMDEAEILQLMFLPGLTTAEKLNLSAGRGVGMSIVKESIESRQGTISIETASQKGTTFTIRIPLALAVTNVLLVKVDRRTFALPLKLVKHMAEFSSIELKQNGTEQVLQFASEEYPVKHLGTHLSASARTDAIDEHVNALLIETSAIRCALMVDEILKSEEIVIKSLGKPLENLKGLIGAAIIGSGEIIPILDLPALLKNKPGNLITAAAPQPADERLCVLVVDDSPSVRHMTSKVVEAAGWTVITAKDGIEALEILQACQTLPNVILTDVEMPRMDGYEMVSSLKRNELFREIPVVFITSRSGEKHRDKASDLGVSDYLAKPFDDAELIGTVKRLAERNVLQTF